ncbi:AraC family transcriptional regulator [Flavobacterium sp. MC2016-06]|jgi:AraC family transcriptional activator of pobA|uniref:helix-turn-helix domain-containing protein n=1 Tax=Flavobacterium sp. MC2016-06 TaxID=2676308 RepID=UPI0012BACC36|nr:AraC family transcriptional regulator [Flavobacterium sp. MC2016-06]MBU3862293.1 AraC family transcriptional regulator [Flavobacterium sp. MC2016-06]
MKPVLTNLSKITDCLAFMNLPIFTYNSEDFSFIKLHEIGIKLPFQSPTFRPDFYNLFIIIDGCGTHFIGSKEFEFSSNQIIISRPESFSSGYWTKIQNVYNISFRKSFLLQYFPASIETVLELGGENGFSCDLTEQRMKSFEQTCLEIYDLAISTMAYKDELIANLILNLLFSIQLHQKSDSKLKLENEKHTTIVSAFRQNMENNFTQLIRGQDTSLMRTKEHSKLLNINENYLSKVISNCTGKTINEWINEKLIDEIKYLLKHSDKSMKEIAELFAFNDLNYFCSYFKSQTLNAPSALRKDFNNTEKNQTVLNNPQFTKHQAFSK